MFKENPNEVIQSKIMEHYLFKSLLEQVLEFVMIAVVVLSMRIYIARRVLEPV
jgi:hypothetical protein